MYIEVWISTCILYGIWVLHSLHSFQIKFYANMGIFGSSKSTVDVEISITNLINKIFSCFEIWNFCETYQSYSFVLGFWCGCYLYKYALWFDIIIIFVKMCQSNMKIQIVPIPVQFIFISSEFLTIVKTSLPRKPLGENMNISNDIRIPYSSGNPLPHRRPTIEAILKSFYTPPSEFQLHLRGMM